MMTHQYQWPDEINANTDAFFRNGASDGRALHLALGVYDNTCIILQGRSHILGVFVEI